MRRLGPGAIQLRVQLPLICQRVALVRRTVPLVGQPVTLVGIMGALVAAFLSGVQMAFPAIGRGPASRRGTLLDQGGRVSLLMLDLSLVGSCVALVGAGVPPVRILAAPPIVSHMAMVRDRSHEERPRRGAGGAYPFRVGLRFETRASDSPWVDAVWSCTSEQISEMTSVAAVSWGLVFWEREGRAFAGISGPETRTATAPVPEGARFVGIEFAVGTWLRAVPTPSLVDGGVELPDATHGSFRLDGVRWETPGPDDAEALVDRLVRAGALVRDPLVTAVRRGDRPAASARTVERRFRAATGLTQGAVRQIERAREAAVLLAAGDPVADVVSRLAYFDEPHLARALRCYVGRTARQLREGAIGAIALNLDQRTS